ncbi:hypothetical protein DFH28DRAFT_497893 [Melampsora americana]|nr:hypothetical protein DFH28DRAFT_497893 [Melampsora americana]
MSYKTTVIPEELQFLSGFILDHLPTLPRSLQPAVLDVLVTRYLAHHWYPDQSERGSGFRAISFDPARQDGYLDPVLRLIASAAKISIKEIRKALSSKNGWTVWCDPGCVSIRYQGCGGELRELWGRLPQHLTSPVGSPRGPTSPTSLSQTSPSKSRAIPILAPSTAARLAGISGLSVIPPTPLPAGQRTTLSGAVDEGDDADLALYMNRPFSLRPSHSRQASKQMDSSIDALAAPNAKLTLNMTEDDPFLRPDSRTSSASSSSGSDHSAFSAVSLSTTSTVHSSATHTRKNSASVTAPASQAPQMFARHHSTSSLPIGYPAAKIPTFHSHAYAFPGHVPGGFVSQPMISRSSSPAPGVKPRRLRERHYSSASVSSMNSCSSGTTRHGGLVLKEGPGTVTEHSGGKVGVMGGGVLLGLPKTEGANSDKPKNTQHSRRGGRRGRGNQNQFSISGFSS